MRSMVKVIVVVLTLMAALTQAQASEFCDSVEYLGNHTGTFFQDQLNEQIAGRQFRINRRKTLIINEVQAVSFTGCVMKVKLGVRLDRRRRRDAIGYINLVTTVDTFDLREQILCIKKTRIKNMNLSHMTGARETTWKWVANAVMPSNSCYEF